HTLSPECLLYVRALSVSVNPCSQPCCGHVPFRRDDQMNKAQLVSAMTERLEWSRSEAAEAVDAIINIVTETGAGGEPVTITGSAKFYRQDRAERMGRNPATGEAIKIPAKRVAKITALKTFKEQVLATRSNGRASKRAPVRR